MKKKRFHSLLLVVVIVFSFAGALAEFHIEVLFNLEVFDKGIYDVIFDDKAGEVKIRLKTDNMDTLNGFNINADNRVTIIPLIQITQDIILMGIGVSVEAKERTSFDKLIIKVDDVTYTYHGESGPVEIGDGITLEIFTLTLGEVGVEMVRTFREAEEIQFILEGSEKSIDFFLSQKIIDGILKMQDDFILAGGLIEELYPLVEALHSPQVE